MANHSANNPIRQIGIITDVQQGLVNAIVTLPGLQDGLVSVAKDLSLRIWMRRESAGHFYPSACIYLRSEGTSLYIDKSGMHLIVGTEDGHAYRYSISLDFTIWLTTKKGINICISFMIFPARNESCYTRPIDFLNTHGEKSIHIWIAH